ncbi:MAG: peptidyl-prolyl cis-trans isomerase [Lachnospiraceae bacterium]|nr:peptidyl-prolyl cis-trans isomerase [Lachnospiraceae bacterium]
MKAKRLVPLLLAAAMGVSVLTGCGGSIDGKKTGATLEGEEISLGFMNFMARYQQAIYDGQFTGMFGTGFWSQDLFGEGTNMVTSVKKNVAENIEILYLLEDHMGDYNVEITEEEIAEMDKAAAKFIEDNTKEAISQMGATQEYVKEMLRLNTIQAKMQAAIEAETDTEVSDEEAAQKTISYVKVNSKSTTDDEGKTKEYTEEEKENLKKEVEAFAASAKDDFKAAAETAGYTVSEGSYGKDDETLDKALTEGADKLKEGEISPVLVGEEAFFVARMDSTFDKEATEKKKTEIVEKRQSDHYKEVCDGYKEGVKYEVNEKEWAKVKFDDLFTIKQEEAEDSGEEAGDSEDKETSEDTGEEAGDSDPAEDGEEAQDSDPAEDSGEEAGDSKDTEE